MKQNIVFRVSLMLCQYSCWFK